MDLAEIDETIRAMEQDGRTFSAFHELLPMLRYQRAMIRQLERNDYREPLPPLTGESPDDEVVA